MSVVVVGLHERDAPLDLLERVAVGERELPKALHSLLDSPHLSEAVVLSTCLRTEVYAVLERFHDGLADLEGFFAARAGGAGNDLADRLLVSYDDAAEQHLFEVAAGIDSAVLGEGEVLRQVRHAGEIARRERTTGPVLSALFRHALVVGKRARSETAIARGITSLAHVAVAEAGERLRGSLGERRALVIGTGEMGGEIAAELGRRGIGELAVASRTLASAQRLVERHGGRAVVVRDLAAELGVADVVFSATAADEVVLELDDVLAAREGRDSRPLLVIDTAVPRDVDPAVGDLDGVELLDLADLRVFAEREMQARRDEVTHVQAIVAEELEEYRLDTRARAVAPLVTTLRQRGEEVRVREFERARRRLAHLDESDQALVEDLTRRLVAKLLHEPTSQIKLAAGSARGERLAEALRVLFDL